MNVLNLNNPNIPIIKSAVEQRAIQFKKLVNKIVMENISEDIFALDDIASKQGVDKAFESVGDIIHKAVKCGLLYQAERIQGLEKELKTAVKHLSEGKKKFAPGTTNSFVDDFLKKHEELLK